MSKNADYYTENCIILLYEIISGSYMLQVQHDF